MKPVLTALALSFAIAASAHADPVDDRVHALELSWDHASYEMPETARLAEFARLDAQAQAVVAQSPGRAEPLVWRAIIVSSEAGLKGGLGGLKLVTEARDLLEKAAAINPRALDGSAYTSLGSLYAQVPGAPLGFGNREKAKSYLDRALAINPTGIDQNYFMGDLLIREHDYAGAVTYLNRAISAPARPSRPIADQGRRGEARALLAKAKQHL